MTARVRYPVRTEVLGYAWDERGLTYTCTSGFSSSSRSGRSAKVAAKGRCVRSRRATRISVLVYPSLVDVSERSKMLVATGLGKPSVRTVRLRNPAASFAVHVVWHARTCRDRPASCHRPAVARLRAKFPGTGADVFSLGNAHWALRCVLCAHPTSTKASRSFTTSPSAPRGVPRPSLRLSLSHPSLPPSSSASST